ncbi:hypothetical protein DPMN_116140 [Dreissena polymorpha]|uniref:Uncharacterized protein n=1 Tax=Dreissena polymorpha TaxID=45954 RepID=A0A9D4QTN4_DREPO|nr:hypothetical protein DPMN_116140 [Dreissena polymorpha]
MVLFLRFSFILSIVDCCLGRKLLCKNQPLPWAGNRPTRPKLVEPSQVCDGIRDCPLDEDEN